MLPAVVGFSFLMFAASLLGAPWMLVRLPADYFTRRHRPLESLSHRPALRLGLLAVKNTAGILLGLAGAAMLVLPGQGLLTLLVALELLDFPGKFAVKRWLISRPLISRPVTRLRDRHGKPPFV